MDKSAIEAMLHDAKAQYEDGEYTEAVGHFDRLAKEGSAEAMYYLAKCHEEGLGVKQNLKKAFKLFKKAAEKGYIPALIEVTYCYAEGKGTERNDILALENASKLQSQGVVLYADEEDDDDGYGIPDQESADMWLKRINELAPEIDFYELARMYREGIEVEKDDKKADFWLKKAEERNKK